MEAMDKVKAYGGLILTFVIWGSLYVVSGIVLQALPTFTVAEVRFVIAFCFLSVLSIGEKKKEQETGKKTAEKIDGTCWKYIIILGLFGYTISVDMQLLGTRIAGSTLASLINALNPVTITLLAAVYLKEILTKAKVIGIGVSVIGVYLIVGNGADIRISGVLLSLSAVLIWSMVSVVTRKGLSKYPPLLITRYGIGIAAICNAFFALAELVFTKPALVISPIVILGLLYMGVFCTGISYILWNASLKVLPASNCSAFYPVQPLTSAVLGVICFHEVITKQFVIGAICIACGILICFFCHPQENKSGVWKKWSHMHVKYNVSSGNRTFK